MDFLSTDLYVDRNQPEAKQEQLAYSCDLIRSATQAAGARFGVFETQAGPHVLPRRMTFPRGMQEPDFLEQCVRAFAAHGAYHAIFFVWQAVRGGAEVGMSGLAEIDSSPPPRTQALPGIKAQAEEERRRPADRPTADIHYLHLDGHPE